MDGTGVPIQWRETAGRKGKQKDGSSKTREAKMIDFWEANTINELGIPIRDPGSGSYSAATIPPPARTSAVKSRILPSGSSARRTGDVLPRR